MSIPSWRTAAGNLWIGTENGLNLYDRDSDSFKRYYLDPPDPSKETQNYVMILHQDAHGRIWVATSNGLNLMETTQDGVRFRHYSDPGSTLRNFILGSCRGRRRQPVDQQRRRPLAFRH